MQATEWRIARKNTTQIWPRNQKRTAPAHR